MYHRIYEPKFETTNKKNIVLFVFRMNLRAAHMFGITFCILQSMIFFAYAAIFYFGAWLIVHDGLNYASMFK